jgi:uncharacterized NAD(P)/FAD-binding protein YdhS
MIIDTPTLSLAYGPADRTRHLPDDARGTAKTTVAVIGAGFSGTLLALHLLRHCPSGTHIHLIEKNSRFGRGLAYSTGNPNHLLNVPAGRMSAFSDRPHDFVDWLRTGAPADGAPVDGASFVERSVFGRYVRHLLNAEIKKADKDRFILSRGEVVGIDIRQGGLKLRRAHGRRIDADIAVLAVGNFPPEVPWVADPSLYDTPYYRPDPWAPDTLADLDPAAPVLLIGTGLTMVDTVISLLDRGHAGPIHALSRRGLLPRRHAAAASAPLLDRPLPTTITALARFARAEVARAERAGGDWRSVIDGLRPALQDVWQSMDAANRARFVRHLRPWWDVHRHRIPPLVADRIERARDRGQLAFGAARIAAYRIDDGAVEVTVRPRRAGARTTYRVARVINCSGPGCDYDRITDPLIRRLLADRQIRPDPLRFGLDVTPQCALRNAHGEISRRLYAIGPVTKALFWEMTSVPDIRRQCESLATHIAAALAAVDAQRASLQADA